MEEQGKSLWNRYPMEHTEIKAIIRENINAVCRNYIAIGYYLKQVQERKLYLEDGYQSLGEYAQAEYGIEKTAASRLIQVVGRFCVNGDTPILLPEYRDFSVSKLKEMLYLTEEQIEQVTADTTVKEIRELRREEPEPELVESVATSQPEEPEKVEEPEEATETVPEEFELTFEPELKEDESIRMEISMNEPETGEEEDLNEPPEFVEGEYREVEMKEPEEEPAGDSRQVKRRYTKEEVKQEIYKCECNFNLLKDELDSGYRYVTKEFMKYDAYCLLLKALEAEEEEKENDDME